MLAINILGILDFNLASGFQKFLNPNNNNATFTHAAILVAIAIPICPKESKRIIEKTIFTITVTPAISIGVFVFSQAK